MLEKFFIVAAITFLTFKAEKKNSVLMANEKNCCDLVYFTILSTFYVRVLLGMNFMTNKLAESFISLDGLYK